MAPTWSLGFGLWSWGFVIDQELWLGSRKTKDQDMSDELWRQMTPNQRQTKVHRTQQFVERAGVLPSHLLRQFADEISIIERTGFGVGGFSSSVDVIVVKWLANQRGAGFFRPSARSYTPRMSLASLTEPA